MGSQLDRGMLSEAMGFVVTCESCQKRLSIPAALYEKKVKGRVVSITCRACQSPIRIDATIPPPGLIEDPSMPGISAGPSSGRRSDGSSGVPRPEAIPSSRRPPSARTFGGAPASSRRPSIASSSQRPMALVPPTDLEFPQIPRAPALPDGRARPAQSALAPVFDPAQESGPASGAELAAPISQKATGQMAEVDDSWDEVADGEAILESRRLDEAYLDGVLAAPLSRANAEEQTRAEPSTHSRRSGADPEAAEEASGARGLLEELGLNAGERDDGYSSDRALEHADGPLSMRTPIASIGRYTLFDKFAVGGMATVHFGRLDGAGGFSRVVALKRLLPHLIQNEEFVEMLLKEARLAGRVRHPNVVPTLDVVASKGEVLIVLEYIHGESLSALCRSQADRQELIPIDIVVAVMLDVFSGLHAVHEAKDERGRALGLVHRDVSPANVIVGIDGLARVLDFGIVKALQLVEETIPNRLKGKTGYMSPEQTRGERVTRRADVFSGGIVLWELLTLHRFASGKSDKERMDRILSGKYERPNVYRPELPDALCDVVMKALAFDPKDRFETAEQLAEALEAAYTPASKGAVVDWVRRLADRSLAERGRMVAQVENWNGRDADLGSTPFAAEARILKAQGGKAHASSPPPKAQPQQAPRARAFGLPALAVFALCVLIAYLLSRAG